jgi:hypothetical protein
MWPVPLAAICVFFEIAELHGAIFVGLTKWCGPRIMQSLVMLIATRHSASALRGLRASARTGRVRSGSGHTTARASARYHCSTGTGMVMGWPMGEAMTREDSARKQSIPYPEGAPDS